MKRLIEFDPLTGVSTYHDYDHASKVTTVEEVQDVAPFLEAGKQLKNDDDYRKKGIKKGWMHLAHIPNLILEKFARESGLDPFSREGINYIVKKIHERDYAHLKTASGRFIRAGK